MKLSERHICVQQCVRSLVFNNIKIGLITFWPCLHFISSKFEELIQRIFKELNRWVLFFDNGR